MSSNPEAFKSFSAVYKRASEILATSISFSTEEVLAKVEAALAALRITRDNQLRGVWGPKTTFAQGTRTEARVLALYEEELAKLEAEITELKTTIEPTACPKEN
jgi:hypothetical protein